MFQLLSERLRLLALTREQLITLSQSRSDMEKLLGLSISNFELSADESFLKEFDLAITDFFIPQVTMHPQDYLWFTHWLIIEKSLNLTIGGIGASGLPDENGEVMIGYFIDKKFEGQGFATEAVKCFTNWMFTNTGLKSIIADTPEEHIASQKVLQNTGFKFYGKVEEGFRWRLE